MRKEIERVITDLHKKIEHADEMYKDAADQGSLFREGMNQGRAAAWVYVINQLNEVLAHAANDGDKEAQP